MRKVLLVASTFLLASLTVACVGQRKTSSVVTDRQVLASLATQGSPDAQYKLGMLYLQSEVDSPDMIESANWFRKAAEQGHVDAQICLAEMYSVGLGVPHDLVETANWFRKAAEQRDAEAQYELSVLYYHGLGVPQSKIFAYQWAKISITNPSLASDDRSNVQEVLDTLTAELAPTEITKAEKLAKQWKSGAGDRSQNTQ